MMKYSKLEVKAYWARVLFQEVDTMVSASQEIYMTEYWRSDRQKELEVVATQFETQAKPIWRVYVRTNYLSINTLYPLLSSTQNTPRQKWKVLLVYLHKIKIEGIEKISFLL